MLDLVTEASTLGALLEETRGVVGVVLGTTGGELRSVVGSFVDGDATADAAAALTAQLTTIGSLLGLGEFGVASLKSATAARVFGRQRGAVVAIELDPKRPLGDLETKLRSLAWAPEEDVAENPAVNRVPTVPLKERITGSTKPPPSVPVSTPPAPAAPPAPPAHSTSPTRPPPPPPPRRAASTTNVPGQVKSVGSGPVFTGDLEEFCLPDLLEFLRNSQRTGLLMCTTDYGIGTIQLSRGMIISADSPKALDLREHFLTSPDLAPERRRVLATLPPECFGDDMIDGMVVARDLLPRDEVERARVARIYSAFREMMAWTAGRFSFDPGVPVVTNPALALSAQSILMQIYQEQDEQGR